jgi:hypothetical protein
MKDSSHSLCPSLLSLMDTKVDHRGLGEPQGVTDRERKRLTIFSRASGLVFWLIC